MRILIADKFDAIGQQQLTDLGCEVSFQPELDPQTLVQAVTNQDPDVVIVRSTRVSAAVIAAAERLKLIVRAGAGYDTIDVAAASHAGVFVANCPGKNAIAVAELAFGLVLCCDRRLPGQSAELRSGHWNKKEYSKARGLFGRTLGIAGFGNIGQEVATRGRAFGMQVLVWSQDFDARIAEQLGVKRVDSRFTLARHSDVVSLHVPLTAQTRHLVNDQFIDAMKPGAYLINTSRGQVVDSAALLRGVRDKGLRAGLDVYEAEPKGATGSFEHPLFAQATVFGSHHVGASTDQAQQAIALHAVEIVRRFAASGEVLDCVNRARRSHATNLLTVRHENRPGVLASVFRILSELNINVEDMENILYQGNRAACARIQLSDSPANELQRLRASSPQIMSVELTQISAEQ
ncbi:MAG: ACT domain-containing protein [Proteobacteria bacterium]|nr:ACT domain-containing protein [Pseudomonadota bacterium]